jgi:hypothetical protein
MVSVRFMGLCSESATSVTAELLDLDDVAACSHLINGDHRAICPIPTASSVR